MRRRDRSTQPHDADMLLYYREAKDGQILEEGITEAGSMASFTAAGTAYSNYGVPTIPFYMYYSMFGFQRIGDMVWAFADSRGKGFLMGGTAGRTTMLGEGLQHQDGHSHVLASTVPTCVTYDPAFVYELAVVIQDGIRRMYEKGEDVFYYITMYNEDYAMPAMPEGSAEGILRGMYKLKPAAGEGNGPVVRQRADSERGTASAGDSGDEVWRTRGCVERDELYGAAAGCAGCGAVEPAASGGEGADTISSECSGCGEGTDHCRQRLHEGVAGCTVAVAAFAAGHAGNRWIWPE